MSHNLTLELIEKMRIGIEAQRLFRKNKHGMDIVAIELIKALQQIDLENEYYIFCNAKNANISEVFPSCPPNFKFVLQPSVNYIIWEQITLPKLASKYRLDILHCTANTAPLLLKTKLLLILHDIIYLEKLVLWKGSLYQRLGNLYRRLIVPRIIHKCEKIGTVSNYENKKITEYFNLNPAQVETYYNAYADHFKMLENKEKVIEFLKENKLPENYILVFGNKDPRKNTVNAILAFAGYARSTNSNKIIPLVILDIDINYYDLIVNKYHLHDIKHHIITKSYVANHNLVYLYSGASLFLFLSTRESFGIPVLEALACGTTVLTSTLSSLPEVAGNAAEFVNPNNVNGISKKIDFILDNPQIRHDLRQKGLSQVQKFSWNNTAEKWLETYKSIIPVHNYLIEE